jgi:hypothetical protein
MEVEGVLVEAVQNSPHSDFLDALQLFAASNDQNVSKTSIDLMTRFFISAEDGEVKKCIAPISETLTTTVNRSSSEVRKAMVLCFVAAMAQHQQKLINVFYSKLCPKYNVCILVFLLTAISFSPRPGTGEAPTVQNGVQVRLRSGPLHRNRLRLEIKQEAQLRMRVFWE